MLMTTPAFTAAVRIISTLRRDGHVALLAGGCVRDHVLGLTPKDYDVATSAPPEVVQQLFTRTQAVGEAFGVVLVHQGKLAIEVATFRREWGYHDGRRPDHVEFTDARSDVLRRDFTINGLLADPLADDSSTLAAQEADAQEVVKLHKGQQLIVLDYVGGLKDLRNGVLRAIGPAEERFAEDYLRMLRAVRFAARFGFEVESRTAAAIRAHARYLGQISRERIGQELRAMLTGPQPAQAIRLMEQLHLDGPVLHEDHQQSRLERVQALKKFQRDDEATGREDEAGGWMTWLLAWVLDRHVPMPNDDERSAVGLRSDIESWCAVQSAPTLRRLRKALVLTNDDQQAWRDAVKLLPTMLRWQEQTIAMKKRTLASAGWPRAQRLVQAMVHDVPTMATWWRTVDDEVGRLMKEGVAPEPWVNGDDLIALGRKPGPVFRRLLEKAYDLQLEGRLESRTAALAWLASQTG